MCFEWWLCKLCRDSLDIPTGNIYRIILGDTRNTMRKQLDNTLAGLSQLFFAPPSQ